MNWQNTNGDCYLLSTTDAGTGPNVYEDAAAKQNTCSYNPQPTSVEDSAAGGIYDEYTDSFWSTYTSADQIGPTVYNVASLQDCETLCDAAADCGYLNYAPVYQYCVLIERKAGGYCQSYSTDFTSAERTN